MTSFAIVGAGWRALFYLRIARELPERFRVTGVLARDPEKGQRLAKTWSVPAVQDLDPLLASGPQFVVTSVPWATNPPLVKELVGRGVPVLSETPPAPDLPGLVDLWTFCQGRAAKVQVAEQYLFQPLHSARLAIAGSGRLGGITQAQVSAAHGYHGISLLRHFLNVGFEDAAITARTFESPLVAGPDREGPPREERLEGAGQTLAWLDFGDRLGVFDFTGSQYFSWVRSPRLLVRGDRGEISNLEVRWLEDYRTPVELTLLRRDTGQAGNLEGYHHEGYLAGTQWVYRNPFAPGRLSDDEVAIATCLEKMGAYSRDEGPSFYSLAEASQDHYLGMAVDRAAQLGQPVRTETQPWSG